MRYLLYVGSPYVLPDCSMLTGSRFSSIGLHYQTVHWQDRHDHHLRCDIDCFRDTSHSSVTGIFEVYLGYCPRSSDSLFEIPLSVGQEPFAHFCDMVGASTVRAYLLCIMAFPGDIAIGSECCWRDILPYIIRKSELERLRLKRAQIAWIGMPDSSLPVIRYRSRSRISIGLESTKGEVRMLSQRLARYQRNSELPFCHSANRLVGWPFSPPLSSLW